MEMAPHSSSTDNVRVGKPSEPPIRHGLKGCHSCGTLASNMIPGCLEGFPATTHCRRADLSSDTRFVGCPLSIRAARQKCQTSFEQGLAETVAWYRPQVAHRVGLRKCR